MNTLKNIGIATLVAIVVVSVGFWLVGSQSANNGYGATLGITAYPHSGLAARFLIISTSTNPSATGIPDGSIYAPNSLFLGNDVIQGSNGWSITTATGTTLTAGQFCSTTSQLISGTTGTTTTTLPSATSTYALCGSNVKIGAYSTQLIDNESTNTAAFAAGTGTTFRCETVGNGTTTVTGGCTQSAVSLTATSTAWATGFWTSSSTQIIVWQGEFH